MITLRKINKQIVKAIKLPQEDLRPIKGFDLCEHLYGNIYEIARKNSGKTSVAFKILKECSNKDTVIIIFCSTVYKDRNWIEIRKYFENKGMDVRVHTSIYEDGEDQIQSLINELKQQAKDSEENDESDTEINQCDNILNKLSNMSCKFQTDNTDEDKPNKPRKSRYQAPEYIIVFDDLSSELKSPSLLSLLKWNRHYKTKVIISSQYINDLLPESRKQIDLFLIFKGFSAKKMQEIHRDCDTSLPFETFFEIYEKATEKPYSFMWVDTRSDKFRQNFDKEFILT